MQSPSHHETALAIDGRVAGGVGVVGHVGTPVTAATGAKLQRLGRFDI